MQQLNRAARRNLRKPCEVKGCRGWAKFGKPDIIAYPVREDGAAEAWGWEHHRACEAHRPLVIAALEKRGLYVGPEFR